VQDEIEQDQLIPESVVTILTNQRSVPIYEIDRAANDILSNRASRCPLRILLSTQCFNKFGKYQYPSFDPGNRVNGMIDTVIAGMCFHQGGKQL